MQLFCRSGEGAQRARRSQIDAPGDGPAAAAAGAGAVAHRQGSGHERRAPRQGVEAHASPGAATASGPSSRWPTTASASTGDAGREDSYGIVGMRERADHDRCHARDPLGAVARALPSESCWTPRTEDARDDPPDARGRPPDAAPGSAAVARGGGLLRRRRSVRRRRGRAPRPGGQARRDPHGRLDARHGRRRGDAADPAAATPTSGS